MKTYILREVSFALGCLIILLVSEVVTLKYQKTIIMKDLLQVMIAFFFAGSLFLGRNLYRQTMAPLARYLIVFALSSILAALFGLIASLTIVNLHLLLGGQL
jgi:hypothetical protein